ncbi:bifunctional nicotinamidase/pyrazinamidase [Moraxella sp. VT-16-12]|uniref:bifunctional nicotinamidase/pyrazinamidase n=1 Tax=Moraxella sp. VT-16-12 TaxID=2014877 RepID=UPI000B7D4880|nr:bifunctional nicotinamidase/pyrazinamidase [Moraxella sp. VT-16-12]TWV81965.1 bifunctional nicotinamidase/pyrazinamidase [Moraxella sp. VT-16-12]
MLNQAHTALLVVDIQNGFVDGNLAVSGSAKIIPVVNQLIAQFDNVILTQDYHPADHVSFYQNHTGKQPFDTIELDYGMQVLWNRHCVQGTVDALFHSDLQASKAQLIIRKGYHRDIDSYSAFMEADRRTMTGLAGYLNERGISHVYVVGIATDFCVAWTAIDAVNLGFDCTVITDATAPIDVNGSLDKAMSDMTKAGVKLMTYKEILV